MDVSEAREVCKDRTMCQSVVSAYPSDEKASRRPVKTITLTRLRKMNILKLLCNIRYYEAIPKFSPCERDGEGGKKPIMGRPCARAHRCVRLSQTKKPPKQLVAAVAQAKRCDAFI
ncbi:hypothetical protein EVAR_8279_1 [Eumeta japonica]|uniref:Uncharacterized protein n=1 Tax=Eumeta variegata TaxID=151549 RepID=A0A4C1Y8N6_EUMVA|nr:hypothetical protein EVAR_8279_1 [Eumeta japonica]